MHLYKIDELPYAEFGQDIKRKVRLVISPYTTGSEGLSIVHVTVSPKGVSEGHAHEDSDEYIYFDNYGKCIVDGEECRVEKNSVVMAPMGKKHACINTSDTEDLHLLCIFIPAFKPYGGYIELIEKTNQHLKSKGE